MINDNEYNALKQGIESVNNGSLDFIGFLRDNTDTLNMCSFEQVKELSKLLVDDEERALLDRAAEYVQDSVITSSSYGPFIPFVRSVCDGNSFIDYINRATQSGDVYMEVSPDMDVITVTDENGQYQHTYDVANGELLYQGSDESVPSKMTEDEFLEYYFGNPIQDAEKIKLEGEKTYSMAELMNRPPKWIVDLELWEHILDKITEGGVKEVRAIVPISIYKRKLEAKQKAEQDYVMDSFETRFFEKYLMDAGYDLSQRAVLESKSGKYIHDIDMKRVSVDDRAHAIDYLAQSLYDKLTALVPKEYADSTIDQINDWCEICISDGKTHRILIYDFSEHCKYNSGNKLNRVSTYCINDRA